MARTKIKSKIGHENDKRGRKKSSSLAPPVSQITISLSRCTRERVETVAMKRLMVRMVCKCPNIV